MNEDLFHLGIKGLLRNSNGEVLLLRVNPAMLQNKINDYWDLPGGRIQKGSSVLETLQREVTEETGITNFSEPKPIGMVMANIRIPVGENDTVGLILSVYECMISDNPEVKISEEHVD